jgi:Ca-activated chloride channel family protein
MNSRNSRLIIILGIIVLFSGFCLLGLINIFMPKTPTTNQTQATAAVVDLNSLTIATSPEMSPLLGKLADQFNGQSKGQAGFVPVKIVTLSPSDMVEAALKPDPTFQAINPDSGLWLSQLSYEWGLVFQSDTSNPDALPIPRQRYALPQRFAASPVVIAMWQSVAQGMGWPGAEIGWNTLQLRASQDANFHWNHPSTAYASGILATLAEFYAGAQVNRGLTEALATQQSTLDYVKKVEATVRFYGEGESAILDRLKKDGTSLLDAFVAQEQIVLRWNSENPGQTLVAVYPVEGTLWADHPLALLERYSDYDHTTLTNPQRDTYYAFASYLLEDAVQKQVLTGGYRPVNMNIDLLGEGSPFKANPSVDALQPKTTLQIPSYPVVQVVQDFQSYIKKPTNVILVVDTSGSMDDPNKLPKVQAALNAFIDNIKGTRDQVGLIEFSDHIKYSSGLATASIGYKESLKQAVNGMQAGGNTAILDAVLEAFTQLESQNDAQAINAIVVMTDGKENSSSRISQGSLENMLSTARVPVVVFSIAFGGDADPSIMKSLADATKGQFRESNSFNILDLYKIISTYF